MCRSPRAISKHCGVIIFINLHLNQSSAAFQNNSKTDPSLSFCVMFSTVSECGLITRCISPSLPPLICPCSPGPHPQQPSCFGSNPSCSPHTDPLHLRRATGQEHPRFKSPCHGSSSSAGNCTVPRREGEQLWRDLHCLCFGLVFSLLSPVALPATKYKKFLNDYK